jgi:hypothetical protein
MQIVIENEALIKRIQALVEREHKTVDEVLETYLPVSDDNRMVDEPYTLDQMYTQARRYWDDQSMMARAELTDQELDEQFWGFDPDGIPRLKSDEGLFEVAESSALDWARAAGSINIAHDGSREHESYQDYVWKRYQDSLNDDSASE